jgi:hypothetical protein
LAHFQRYNRQEFFRRNQGQHHNLTDDRMELLNTIGFVWNTYDTKWRTKYQKLLAFQKIAGHVDLPLKYPTDQSLANWVNKQRTEHRKGRMAHERIQLLEDIGFRWERRREQQLQPS